MATNQVAGRMLLAVGVLSTLAGGAPAQFQQPRFGGISTVTQPVVSPYINLLRRDNPTYLNYYGLVRPEVEFRNSINQLQQQVTTNQQSITELGTASTLPVTGHPAYFLNTSRYFLTLTPTGGGARGFTGTPGTPSPASAAPSVGRPSQPSTPARR